MDFEFDEHQNDLQGAVREILTKEVPSRVLRKVIDGDSTDALWQTYVSLDWPGLALDVAHGGSGATAVELAIVIEQLGYVADPTGFVATTTQFAPLVAACGNDAQRARLLGAVASGGTATIALGAPSGRWNAETSPVSTRRTDAGWVLEGTACFVLDGDRADEIAVIARTDGSADGSADGGDIDGQGRCIGIRLRLRGDIFIAVGGGEQCRTPFGDVDALVAQVKVEETRIILMAEEFGQEERAEIF